MFLFMKHKNRLFAAFLAFVLLFSFIPYPAFAAANEDHETSSTNNSRSIFNDVLLYDGSGNAYGFAGWSSFSEARQYYGYDWIYSSCSKYYSGNYYNYYFTYSDSTRIYFGVSTR